MENAIAEAKEETTRLRGILSSQLFIDKAEKKQNEHEKKFWKEIATPSLIDDSKPPTDFKVLPFKCTRFTPRNWTMLELSCARPSLKLYTKSHKWRISSKNTHD